MRTLVRCKNALSLLGIVIFMEIRKNHCFGFSKVITSNETPAKATVPVADEVTVPVADGTILARETSQDARRCLLMVTLRPVEREMLPQTVELHVRSWQEAYRGIMPDEFLNGLSVERQLARQQERFGEKTSNEYAILVDESIIGVCFFASSRDDDADQVGEIYGFYLHPDVWVRDVLIPR